MKTVLRLVSIGILCITLVGCGKKLKLGEESKYVLSNDIVSMSIKEDSLTNTKATLVLVNHTDETYIYGGPYLIECEKDGIWYEIIPIGEMVYGAAAHYLRPKQSKEINFDWESGYPNLTSGKYRFIISGSLGDNKLYIGTEFTIK